MGYNKSLDFLNMIKNGESALENNTFHKAEQLHKTEHFDKAEPIFKTLQGSEIQDVHNKAKAHAKQVNRKTANILAEPKSINFAQKSIQSAASFFAVIDTETNWNDEVMSLGVAIADNTTFKCLETRYYIFEQEARIGGMYSSVLYKCTNGTALFSEGTAQVTYSGESEKESKVNTAAPVTLSRKRAMADLTDFLASYHITSIYAYNAKFDCGHLPELKNYSWYDIMRIAAYKQFNKSIPDTAPCCKTGSLKSNYGVEPITRMLTGNSRYYEVHNAVADAVDELRIIELLNLPLASYDIARING